MPHYVADLRVACDIEVELHLFDYRCPLSGLLHALVPFLTPNATA